MDLFNPFRSNPDNNNNQMPHAPVTATNQVHQSINQTATRGAALWTGGQNHEFQGRTRYPPQHGHSPRGFFPGQQRGGRGQPRGRSRGGPYGYNRGGPQRGAAFQSTRNSGSANPAPGLFRPQPENHYCETCDLEFRNEQKFDDHVKNHVKCPKCDFVGVFDSIEEHFELIHLTILKNRLKPVETEEELKLWREERRERYPRPKARNQRPVAEKSTKLPLFLATVGDFEKNSADLSDGEIEDEEKTIPTVSAPSAANTLMSLLGCYGEVDSDSEGPEEIPISTNWEAPPGSNPVEQPVSNPNFSKLPDDVDKNNCTTTHVEGVVNVNGNTTDHRNTNFQNTISDRSSVASLTSNTRLKPQPYRLPLKRKPRTLYEKLVAKDIEKDNDKLIQCIVHILKNFVQVASAN